VGTVMSRVERAHTKVRALLSETLSERSYGTHASSIYRRRPHIGSSTITQRLFVAVAPLVEVMVAYDSVRSPIGANRLFQTQTLAQKWVAYTDNGGKRQGLGRRRLITRGWFVQ
jgi:hypothetical protein